ncbi:MAG TPA: T9SS type A sorting domain-containing protein [Paludibacter sp.]|nr:T9SS type A sorting domain-containing protein [Paludibacter sp.]
MKKTTFKLLAVILAVSLNSSLIAQTTVNWPLSNTTAAPTNVAPTPTSGTGFTAASQTQSVCNQLSWTGYGSDGQQTAQRVKTADATRSLPSAFATDTYVEYAITAATGYNLSVSQIKMYLGGGGTTSIFAQIKYSTDDFATSATLDAGGTALQSNSATVIDTKTFSSLAVAVNAGSTLKVRVYPKNTGSASTTKYLINNNVSITFTSTPTITTPTIAKTSGADPASVMETSAMTPVVYNYINVADDANVLSNWYTDNSYTTTTTAPSGLSIDKNTTAKTVTVSGSPALATAGTYYYKLSVNETNGNSVQGSVVVTPYVTPTPSIAGGANANFGLKPGAALTNIVYTIGNASDATVSGLPAGLSGTYNNGTYTISGTVDASVTPAVYPFTVNAIPLAGYTGDPVTATGSVVVKSLTAKQIYYLTATGTPSVNDTKLYPMLNSSINYIVNLKTAASAAPAASTYDAYDLIVINEIVGGTNAEALALKAIDKPILSLKAFTYTSGRWSWGVPDNGLSTNGTVTVKQVSHPVFTGIDVSAGTLSLLTGATGNGIQPVDVSLLSGRSINVATAPKSTTGNPMAVAIHDVPASVRGVANSKYILIPVADASYPFMNSTMLLLVNNAIEYLLNGTQYVAPTLEISSFNVNSVAATIDNTANTINATLPIGTVLSALQPTVTLTGTGTTVSPASTVATDFTNSGTSAVNYTVTDGISSKVYAVKIVEGTTALSQNKISGVTFDGRTIYNVSNLELQVFDATGRKVVSSNKDINMSSNSKGIYFVKSNAGTFKIVVNK